MKTAFVALFAVLLALRSAHAGAATLHQPEITADDLSWVAGYQYVKGSFDSTDPERPQKLRLILQRKGREDEVLVAELPIPHAFGNDLPTDFLFISMRQPDDRLKLFLGASDISARAYFAATTDAFSKCQMVCVKYLAGYKLTKGKHVLLYGDGGAGATDPASDDFNVRVVLEAN